MDDAKDRPSTSRVHLQSELSLLDRSIYGAVARTPTPALDSALLGLTSAADHSKLWLGTAGVLAVVGGHRGRTAAGHGLAAVGLASVSVNQVFKRVGRRRPDRAGAGVPVERLVPMPTSTSFPSGHSASAFAFAEGVGHTMPGLAVLLRISATVVAYTRVHAGVHYPGDVIVGSLIGIACGGFAPRAVDAALVRRTGVARRRSSR